MNDCESAYLCCYQSRGSLIVSLQQVSNLSQWAYGPQKCDENSRSASHLFSCIYAEFSTVPTKPLRQERWYFFTASYVGDGCTHGAGGGLLPQDVERGGPGHANF